MGHFPLVAPPPGVAHLSDAIDAEVVAWITAPVAASGAVDGHRKLAPVSLSRCYWIRIQSDSKALCSGTNSRGTELPGGKSGIQP
jgi:hypothetical protein